MIYKFTSRAKKAIEIAGDEATALGHNYIGSEHILYGLIKEGAGVASRVLANQDISYEDVENKIIEMIGKESYAPMQDLGFTPRSKRIIENSPLELKYREDLVINGLGWVKIVDKGIIDVYIDKNIQTFIRKNFI